VTELVIAGEEEELVAQDRAADRAAEVVDAERPFGDLLRVVGEGVGVERFVAAM
jgi:hypothetical protein